MVFYTYRLRFLGRTARGTTKLAEVDTKARPRHSNRDGIAVFCWHGHVIYVYSLQSYERYCVFYSTLDALSVSLSGNIGALEAGPDKSKFHSFA